ncbi:MAG: 2-oxoacid:acceptor oxidoreductase family protein [Eubacteriales bacterium]|nr:2-oxoacid:acceptor oxidoreductase family protein [Eubacteriales bacterium]
MATHKILIAGFGGQGIILIGQMLAYAAMMDNKEVTFLPSYGPEMRGGTANCTIVISDSPISCPLVDKATCLVVMNQPSLAKYEDMVEPGGTVFINSSLVKQGVKRSDLTEIAVEAGELAIGLGNEKMANIVMLGALIRKMNFVSEENMEKVLAKVFSGRKEHLLEGNRVAFHVVK